MRREQEPQVSVNAASQLHGFRIPFTSFVIVRGDGYHWSKMMIASDRERRAREAREAQETTKKNYRLAIKNREEKEMNAVRRSLERTIGRKENKY